MKKKIIIFSLFFILIFNSNAFAKTFESKTNVDPHKVWTIKFNKDIKTVDISLFNKDNLGIAYGIEIDKNLVVVTSLLDYQEGDYILKVTSARAKDGSYLKEPTEIKFTVKK